MGAPTSPVDICNMALDAIGEGANIASIEMPENSNEILLARHYDITRKSLLRNHVWNFARAETTLARVTDGGLDYADSFLMPNDCLRVMKLGTRYWPIRDFNIYGRNILINTIGDTTNALEIRYVKDVTDVSLFDASFIQVLALQLAVNVSYAVSEKRNQVELVNSRLKQELPEAVSVNAQERKPKKINRSKWLDARHNAALPHISYNGVYWIDVW